MSRDSRTCATHFSTTRENHEHLQLSSGIIVRYSQMQTPVCIPDAFSKLCNF